MPMPGSVSTFNEGSCVLSPALGLGVGELGPGYPAAQVRLPVLCAGECTPPRARHVVGAVTGQSGAVSEPERPGKKNEAPTPR